MVQEKCDFLSEDEIESYINFIVYEKFDELNTAIDKVAEHCHDCMDCKNFVNSEVRAVRISEYISHKFRQLPKIDLNTDLDSLDTIDSSWLLPPSYQFISSLKSGLEQVSITVFTMLGKISYRVEGIAVSASRGSFGTDDIEILNPKFSGVNFNVSHLVSACNLPKVKLTLVKSDDRLRFDGHFVVDSSRVYAVFPDCNVVGNYSVEVFPSESEGY